MQLETVYVNGKPVGVIAKAGQKLGFSVLSPRDTWDEQKGVDIAIARAFTKRKGRPWAWRPALHRMVLGVPMFKTKGEPLTDEAIEKLGRLHATAEYCKALEAQGAEARKSVAV